MKGGKVQERTNLQNITSYTRVEQERWEVKICEVRQDLYKRRTCNVGASVQILVLEMKENASSLVREGKERSR